MSEAPPVCFSKCALFLDQLSNVFASGEGLCSVSPQVWLIFWMSSTHKFLCASSSQGLNIFYITQTSDNGQCPALCSNLMLYLVAKIFKAEWMCVCVCVGGGGCLTTFSAPNAGMVLAWSCHSWDKIPPFGWGAEDNHEEPHWRQPVSLSSL
jgi:hypothetical protein